MRLLYGNCTLLSESSGKETDQRTREEKGIENSVRILFRRYLNGSHRDEPVGALTFFVGRGNGFRAPFLKIIGL